MLKLESVQNPKVKYISKLRKRRFRDEEDKILIEGFDEVRMAIANNIELSGIFVCKDFFYTPEKFALLEEIESYFEKRLLFETTQNVFRKIAYRENPDGWLAIGKAIHHTLDEIHFKTSPLVIVAESVEKPGNLGTILRTADAVGADVVILTDPTTDINNPNVVKASTGAIFTVPVIETTNDEALIWLKENGIQIVSTTLQAKREYTKVDFRQPTAVLMGTEKTGLTDFWRKHCDEEVIIPMIGQVNSLNVATSTAIMMYEALKQRMAK